LARNLKKDHGIVALCQSIRENDCLGGIFHYGRRAIYKYGASDLAHQELEANNWLSGKPSNGL